MKKYIYQHGLKIPIEIIDTRHVFGRKEYLIKVIGSDTQKWVWASRLIEEKHE